jgi:hypothetical protein
MFTYINLALANSDNHGFGSMIMKCELCGQEAEACFIKDADHEAYLCERCRNFPSGPDWNEITKKQKQAFEDSLPSTAEEAREWLERNLLALSTIESCDKITAILRRLIIISLGKNAVHALVKANQIASLSRCAQVNPEDTEEVLRWLNKLRSELSANPQTYQKKGRGRPSKDNSEREGQIDEAFDANADVTAEEIASKIGCSTATVTRSEAYKRRSAHRLGSRASDRALLEPNTRSSDAMSHCVRTSVDSACRPDAAIREARSEGDARDDAIDQKTELEGVMKSVERWFQEQSDSDPEALWTGSLEDWQRIVKAAWEEAPEYAHRMFPDIFQHH